MRAFVGRQPELAALRARLVEARAGAPQIVELEGPPGIGKTALVARFLADPGGDPPPVVLSGSGEETETLLAYGVIDQLGRSAGRGRTRPVGVARPPAAAVGPPPRRSPVAGEVHAPGGGGTP